MVFHHGPELGRAYLRSDRVVGSARARAGELGTLLLGKFPAAPEVIQYHQQYQAIAAPTPLPALS